MTKKVDIQDGDPKTTGHEWDGIQEFDNPMPRWWLWTLYATIIWALGNTIANPAWPMISSATTGVMGWSSRAKVAAEIAAVDAANAPVNAKLAELELAAIPGHPELGGYAVSSGAAVFRTWCAQCHGSGAAGARGYPNLLDDDWLWGGSIEDIHATISYGIRNEESADARFSMMPAFGRDQLLVTGVYAHIGCTATVVEAFQRDIEAFIAADAVADFSRADHDQALHWIARTSGVPMTTDQLLEVL